MTGSVRLVVERMDGGPRLVIEDALALVQAYLDGYRGASSPWGFDARAGTGDPNRISTEEISAANSLSAHGRHEAWVGVANTKRQLPWLAAIHPDWDVILMSDQEWADAQCEVRLAAALDAALGYRRGPAGVTKVLHLKRPRFIPMLDGLVAQQLGAGRAPLLDAILHLRQQGRANLEALDRLVDGLGAAGIQRSRVRALEITIWASHPAASLTRQLGSWERVIRPRRRR